MHGHSCSSILAAQSSARATSEPGHVLPFGGILLAGLLIDGLVVRHSVGRATALKGDSDKIGFATCFVFLKAVAKCRHSDHFGLQPFI